MLRFFILLTDDNACRYVGDPHRRIGGVDRLPARAGSTEHVNPQVAFLNVDINILGLGKHRHRGCRGMDTTPGLGFRHTLHTMHA